MLDNVQNVLLANPALDEAGNIASRLTQFARRIQTVGSISYRFNFRVDFKPVGSLEGLSREFPAIHPSSGGFLFASLIEMT